MFKKILLVLVLIVAIFAVVVAMQPDEMRVSRSASIAAPPAVVFDQANDFHKWEAWNPWGDLDPNAKTTFEGPESGVGAQFGWDGNNEVGQGMMTILESKPAELVKYKIEFKRPMEGVSTGELHFAPEGEGTKVTWLMYGPQNFVGKAFCLVMNGQKMIGDQFDKGLASMKAVAEKTANPAAAEAAAPKVDGAEPKVDAAAPKVDGAEPKPESGAKS